MTRLDRSHPARFAAVALAALLTIAGRGAIPTPARAAQGPGTQAGAPAADPRAGDRAAIRDALQSFVRAFEARDAKALAGHWTDEGEYRGEDGAAIRGRAALESSFAAFFARTPEVKAELRPESLRFLGRDAAVDEGTVDIRRGGEGPAARARYEALLSREDGRWLLARMTEATDDEPSLDDLAWLVGNWRSAAGQDAEVVSAYAKDENGKFLRVRFEIREKDRTLSGFQVLGKDPATGDIRAWTFEAEGGIGDAVWVRDGDHWTVDSTGTLADGRTLISTNILRRIDNDTFTWQSIGRTLDDEPIPDLPPVKVTRVKPVAK